MSVLFETDLTEYARQCTIERRHYEECVQEAQQDGMDQAAAASACSISHAETFNECTDKSTPGCVVDLLGLSVESLVWEDGQAALYDVNKEVVEARQWHSDSQSTQPPIANTMRKNAKTVSYGAP